jgi:hypothetical protein
MPNRMMSFAVLLFSFAIALLGFQPKAGTPTASYNREFHVPVITPPVQTYWVFGSLVIAASLFFIVVAYRRGWSKSVKKFMTQIYIRTRVSRFLAFVCSNVAERCCGYSFDFPAPLGCVFSVLFWVRSHLVYPCSLC